MDKKLLDAKELFIKYKYSHYGMWHESPKEYNLYKQKNITKEQELIWIHEYIGKIFNKISKSSNNKEFLSNFIELCRIIADNRDFENLKSLIDVIQMNENKFDSYTMVIIGSTIVNMICGPIVRSKCEITNEIKQLEQIFQRFLTNVINNPIIVDLTYLGLEKNDKLKAERSEKFSDKNIREIAKNSLNDWELYKK